MNLIQKIFGTHSEREVKMIMPLVEKRSEEHTSELQSQR